MKQWLNSYFAHLNSESKQQNHMCPLTFRWTALSVRALPPSLSATQVLIIQDTTNKPAWNSTFKLIASALVAGLKLTHSASLFRIQQRKCWLCVDRGNCIRPVSATPLWRFRSIWWWSRSPAKIWGQWMRLMLFGCSLERQGDVNGRVKQLDKQNLNKLNLKIPVLSEYLWFFRILMFVLKYMYTASWMLCHSDGHHNLV